MHIKTPLLALAALAGASTASNPDSDAWMLPENLKFPAVYEWTFVPHKKGEETTLTQFEIDYTLNITAKTPTTKLPLLPDAVICHPLNPYNNDTINGAHEIIAMELLMNWCEQYQPSSGSVVAAVYGEMSWFLCGYDRMTPLNNLRTCSRDEAFVAARLLDRYCGRGNPGEVKMLERKRAYGRGIPGTGICRKVIYQPGVDA